MLNDLYTEHSAMFMRVSSDPNDVIHLASSDDLMGIQESYANIQVDEGTITIVEKYLSI